MNLVAECTTMSAPTASGCWRSGVAKVLSTTTCTPAAWPAATTAGRSTTSSAGLVGDSSHSSAASWQASAIASGSVTSTSAAAIRPRDSRSASCMIVPL